MIASLPSTRTHYREVPLGPRTNFKFTLTATGFILLFVACQIGEQVLTDLVGKNRARSLLCSHGQFSRFANRALCEVDTQLDSSSFRSAFPEQDDASLEEMVVEDTSNEPPSGPNTVAFVVTIPSCDDDDFGGSFYDAAAVLRHSVCNCTLNNPLSGSQYNNTMYAIIHPDAAQCWAPTDSKDDTNLTAYKYNRIEILEELGYWVKVWGEPIRAGQLNSGEKQTDTDFKDLLSLRAYELTNHEVAVMMKFDTVFMENIDAEIDKLKSDENRKGIYTRGGRNKVNSGMLLIKPDEAEFNTIIESFKNTDYNAINGWDGSGHIGLDTEGILSYHYSRRASNYLDDTLTMELTKSIQSFREEPSCKLPWKCFFGSDWTQSTIDSCRTLNHNWYTFRKDFEQNFWSKSALVDDTVSSYHRDFFSGYCDDNGQYQRFADYASSEWGLEDQAALQVVPFPGWPNDFTPSDKNRLTEEESEYYVPNKNPNLDINLDFGREAIISGAYFQAWYKTTISAIKVGIAPDDGAVYTETPVLPKENDPKNGWQWFNFESVTTGTDNEREVDIPDIRARYVKYRFSGAASSYSEKWGLKEIEINGYFPS